VFVRAIKLAVALRNIIVLIACYTVIRRITSITVSVRAIKFAVAFINIIAFVANGAVILRITDVTVVVGTIKLAHMTNWGVRDELKITNT
jgi:hypothetical protein